MKKIESILQPVTPTSMRIEAEKYHRWEFLNASSLVAGLVPKLYSTDEEIVDVNAVKMAFENSSTATDAMERGTLAHMMILEPHTVASRVAIWRGGTRRGAEWDAFEEDHSDRLIVRLQDYEEVSAGCMVVSNNPIVRGLLHDCEIEQSIIWPEGKIACKGRLDACSKSDNGFGGLDIIDIKTTQRIDSRSCQQIARRLHYREKMAFYRRGFAALKEVDKSDVRCLTIFVKLEPPFGINIMQLVGEGLDFAEQRMMTALTAVQDAIENNKFSPLVISSKMGIDSWEEEVIDV